MTFDLLVRNTSSVVTAAGPLDAPAEQTLAAVPRGVVGVKHGRVQYLGAEESLPAGAVDGSTRVVDAGGGFVGPGFVDSHTHLVFAGDRCEEFHLRNAGASYLEIAARGGGIANTVRATRASSVDALLQGALPRLQRLLEFGVTTAEVKSGYGLTLDDELKMLRTVQRLSAAQPVALVPTLLCAHALPEEYAKDRAGYLELCRSRIIPAVAEQSLARFFDVFVESGAFTPDETRALAATAKQHGLIPRLHADQLSANGGAELAAELGASSADHLEQISAAGIEALARGGVVAVLVPVSSLFLRVRPYAPGRALRDAGVTVALGTNVNPGSAMSENVALTLGLACLENGLTGEEAYLAMTRGGAEALRLPEAGRLQVGGPADLVVFGCDSPTQLPYHLGVNQARWVFRAGRLVAGTEPHPV